MRRDLLGRIQQIFFLISILLLLTIGLLTAQVTGIPWARGGALRDLLPSPPQQPRIVLVSGHAGNDSGAICTDTAGNVTITEADVNKAAAQRVAELVRQANRNVEVFTEFDERLDGLVADLFISLHADSCVELSGYKAAHRENAPSTADTRLLACIDQNYPAATGLTYQPDTITRDMVDYHAFRKIDRSTPALILEMGFLGGDQVLLTDGMDQVAQGITNAIDCFLRVPPNDESQTSP